MRQQVTGPDVWRHIVPSAGLESSKRVVRRFVNSATTVQNFEDSHRLLLNFETIRNLLS